ARADRAGDVLDGDPAEEADAGRWEAGAVRVGAGHLDPGLLDVVEHGVAQGDAVGHAAGSAGAAAAVGAGLEPVADVGAVEVVVLGDDVLDPGRREAPEDDAAVTVQGRVVEDPDGLVGPILRHAGLVAARVQVDAVVAVIEG